MPTVPPEAIETLGAGLVVLVLGALVKFREWTFLVAGYDSTSPLPSEVVADLVGNTVIRVGAAVLALGALQTLTNPPAYLGWAVEIAILLAVIRLLYRLHTHPAATDADAA